MPVPRDNAKDYTPQERVEILRDGQDTDVVNTCKKYNITRVAYYQWKKDYDETIEQLWGKKKAGRKPKDAHIDVDELKKENEKLKREIEENKKKAELEMLLNLPVEEALKRVTDDFIRESWPMKDKRKIARIIENLEEVTVEEACEAIGITVQTYYNWRNLKGPKKRAPVKSPPENDYHALFVLDLVLENSSWGGEKISLELMKKGLCVESKKKCVELRKQAKEYIEENSLKKKSVGYEFQNPDDAWCIDFKYIPYCGRYLYLFKLIDDKSRFDIAFSLVEDATTQAAIDLVEKGMKVTGSKPYILKSDRGAQFKKEFSRYLKGINIYHLKSIPYYAKYNGKVEYRFRVVEAEICSKIRTEYMTKKEILNEIAKESYRHNFVDPHLSLGRATPAEEYYGLGEEIRKKIRSFYSRERNGKKMRTPVYKTAHVSDYIPGATCNQNVKIKN